MSFHKKMRPILRSMTQSADGLRLAPDSNWGASVRHLARVYLLVASVAICWIGLFGLLGLERMSHESGRYLFVSPAIAWGMLASGLALIAAQVDRWDNAKFARAWAALAILIVLVVMALDGLADRLVGNWVSVELIAVFLAMTASLCAFIPPRCVGAMFRWPDRASVALTVLGTLFSVGGAYWLVEHESSVTDREVRGRAVEVAQTLQDSLARSSAGFQRMAQRWSSIEHSPSRSFIDMEFVTYLRDMPEAVHIAALDDRLTVMHSRQGSAARSEDLEYLMSQQKVVDLMNGVRETEMVDLLAPKFSPDPMRVAFAVAGWRSPDAVGGVVLVTFDIKRLVKQAFSLSQPPCCIEIRTDDIAVYRSTGQTFDGAMHLSTASFEHTDGDRFEVFYWLEASDPMVKFDRFAILFMLLGLAFTFFVSNSQRLAHIANARAREVQHRSFHDPVTELPNRQMLEQFLPLLWQRHRRWGQPVSMLLVAVEGLRLVNDSIGHQVGDALLLKIAQRLRCSVPEHSLLARVDGGEFALGVIGLDDEQLAALAKDLIDVVCAPVKVEPHLLRVSSVLGITTSKAEVVDASRLLREADLAMLQARRTGQNTWFQYTEQLGSQVSEHMSLQTDLQNAVSRGQLSLHYQPFVDGRTGAIVGFEALMRWHHPEFGQVSPTRFIPMAEESGQIVALTNWALDVAAKDALRLNADAPHPVSVAVNISPVFFQRVDFVQCIRGALSDSGLDPSLLEVEITESLLLEEQVTAVAKLNELSELGVSVSLDDFGTGYSSLNYLKRLPIRKVKLDRSFVSDVVADAADAAIARAVVALASLLKLKVVVEGVETPTQFAFLKRIHCDQFQGYLFARPMTFEKALQLLASSKGYVPLPESVAGPGPIDRAVMLVGPASEVVQQVEQIFERSRCRVFRAHGVDEATEMLAMHTVQAVVSVALLSDGYGTDLFSRIRHLYPRVQRILVADLAQRQSFVDDFNEGTIDRMIPSPVDTEWVLEMIRRELPG